MNRTALEIVRNSLHSRRIHGQEYTMGELAGVMESVVLAILDTPEMEPGVSAILNAPEVIPDWEKLATENGDTLQRIRTTLLAHAQQLDMGLAGCRGAEQVAVDFALAAQELHDDVKQLRGVVDCARKLAQSLEAECLTTHDENLLAELQEAIEGWEEEDA